MAILKSLETLKEELRELEGRAKLYRKAMALLETNTGGRKKRHVSAVARAKIAKGTAGTMGEDQEREELDYGHF